MKILLINMTTLNCSARDLLNKATQQLQCISATPRLDAEILLMQVLNINHAQLISYSRERLSETKIAQFNKLIQRRLTGEPIAYIVGEKEFWSLTLAVNPQVLIPRPETELLIELALQLLPADEMLTVADLGTGSGAIALALAHERKQWQIFASDQSMEALTLASHNAKKLNLSNIHFCQSQWCHAYAKNYFNAIITNPPYLAEDDPHLQDLHLCHEPVDALVAGKTGLEAISAISVQAFSCLQKGGWIFIEHGYQQGEHVANILEKAGFVEVTLHRDLAGLPRVTMGRANNDHQP